MYKINIWVRQNLLFVIAASLAIIAVIFGQFDPTYIKYDVLVSLFGLMIVLAFFQTSGLLRWASIKLIDWSGNSRVIVQSMVLASFFGSFLLSNDIAVLTLLPIYLNILRHLPAFKGRVLGAALIVVAANLGGVFFPFSNPQNLIIYSTYPVDFVSFMWWTLPLVVAGFILVMVATFFVEKRAAHTQVEGNAVDRSIVIQASIGMVLMVIAIFGLFNIYWTVAFIVAYVLMTNWRYLLQVDYLLLLTFASFFVLVGNITDLTLVQTWLAANISSKTMAYLTGLLASQVFSNVPTTILVSPFTDQAHSLLMGVNIGGLGTMVASLANLIGFTIIRNAMSMDSRAYFKIFTIINVIFILILALLFFPW